MNGLVLYISSFLLSFFFLSLQLSFSVPETNFAGRLGSLTAATEKRRIRYLLKHTFSKAHIHAFRFLPHFYADTPEKPIYRVLLPVWDVRAGFSFLQRAFFFILVLQNAKRFATRVAEDCLYPFRNPRCPMVGRKKRFRTKWKETKRCRETRISA